MSLSYSAYTTLGDHCTAAPHAVRRIVTWHVVKISRFDLCHSAITLRRLCCAQDSVNYSLFANI